MNKELTFKCILCVVGIMVVDTVQVKESTFSEWDSEDIIQDWDS